MDLDNQGALFFNNEPMNCNYGDTALRLDCFGYGGSNNEFVSARTDSRVNSFSLAPLDDGCGLVLGLGPSPSSYSNGYHFPQTRNPKSLDSTMDQGDSILKLGLSGENENISKHNAHHKSSTTIPLVDEGSSSAKKSGGYMPTLLLAPIRDCSKTQEVTVSVDESLCSEPSAVTDYSIATSSDRRSNPKKCKFEGCTKGARGATGLCISHGGGQRCQRPGCNKGSESRTAYCKAHGGGKRCQHLGCTKSAEGKTDNCIAHGGGRRCGHPDGCTKAARGKSGLCIRHGGGKRCKIEGCSRSAEGQIGLCISHGGGRRCQFLGCSKGAQGSTMYCKAHGGGKRCVFAGCTKGAEGSTPLCKGHGGGKRCLFDGGGICPKSVHGGTNFCVAHGGGKRCSVPGCTKSARGRTDCCVKHGGGKRCKFENCGKSAQGSTDFCKAHGGGKRCNWGEGKCEKFARGRNGMCAAHSTLILERETNKRGMIGRGLFHGLVSGSIDSSSGVSIISDSSSGEKPAKRRQLIPPQVLVPLSMKSFPSCLRPLDGEKGGEDGSEGLEFSVTEGRVHGGGLVSLLGGSLNNAIDGI